MLERTVASMTGSGQRGRDRHTTTWRVALGTVRPMRVQIVRGCDWLIFASDVMDTFSVVELIPPTVCLNVVEPQTVELTQYLVELIR